jgi:hypothetical protein
MDIRDFLANLTTVRGSYGMRQWSAKCPAHDDGTSSLSIGQGEDGRILVTCHAGCDVDAICESLDIAVAELFQSDDLSAFERPAAREPSVRPLASTAVTVEALANAKGLSAELLFGFDLVNLSDGGVAIPYFDANGHATFKTRTSLVAKEGSRWPRGVSAMAYGIWLLPLLHRPRRRILLVEGESDCWTAWSYGIPAIGIPGATACKTITLEVLEGIDRIDVLQERDRAGEEFVVRVRDRLSELGWAGEARVVTLPTK